jgi:hypothetical protein
LKNAFVAALLLAIVSVFLRKPAAFYAAVRLDTLPLQLWQALHHHSISTTLALIMSAVAAVGKQRFSCLCGATYIRVLRCFNIFRITLRCETLERTTTLERTAQQKRSADSNEQLQN